MRQTYTAATIGGGSIAQHLHLPGYAKRKDITRIVTADPVAERRDEVTKHFPVTKTYADYRELFDHETPNFVSICSPNLYHAEHAIAALQAGAHVLLEKPMTLTLDDARAVGAAAQAAAKQVMIGFSHRFYRGNQRAKALIAQGIIGEPFMMRARFAHGGPFPGWAKSDWFYDPRIAGGGALLDMGIHAIDLCQWLIGPITSVSAQIGTLRKAIQVDDNAVLALEFERALGYIEVGWTSGPGFCGFEVYGDRGTIIHNYPDGLRVCTGTSSPDHEAAIDYKWEVIDNASTTGGWPVEIDHFVDTVLAGNEFEMGLEAGISSLAVALAAIASAQNGRREALTVAQ